MCFNKSCTLARASPTNGEIHAIRLSPRAFLPARSPALGRQSKSGVPASKLTRGGMGRRTKSGLPVPKLAHGHGWIEDSLRERVVDLLRENEKKRRVKESAGSSGVSRTPCRSRVCHHRRGAKRNCRWCMVVADRQRGRAAIALFIDSSSQARLSFSTQSPVGSRGVGKPS